MAIQIGTNVCSVRAVGTGKWLFSSMDNEMSAEAELVLISCEGFATHRTAGAPLQARRSPQQWWEDRVSAYTSL